MEIITSPSNQKIKFSRSLRQKKNRDTSGKYYIEGIRLVGEAFAARKKIHFVIVCNDLLGSNFGNELVAKMETSGIEILSVSKHIFETISLKDGPQGIAAVLEMNWSSLERVSQLRGVWVALDSVQDPGNLGTVLRSLDAVGGKGVILLDDSTDPFHPTSVRASTGGLFSQQLIKTTFDNFLQWKVSNNYPVIGTFCGDVDSYRGYNYPIDMILMNGSEQKGLQQSHLDSCDGLVTIPMQGTVDSLNLAVATSLVLFEIFSRHTGQ